MDGWIDDGQWAVFSDHQMIISSMRKMLCDRHIYFKLGKSKLCNGIKSQC